MADKSGAKSRLGKRQQQAIETRERIFTCANRLFIEKGYDQTTVADIASAAGISIGGFYHHFKNKDEIMRIWIGEFDIRYRKYYEEELSQEPLKSEHPLQKILLFMVEANRTFSSFGFMLSRMSYVLMLRDMEIGDMIVDKNRDYFDIATTLVREAAEAGCFKPQGKVDDIVQDLTLISRGCMVDWALNHGRYYITERMERQVRYYLQAVAADTSWM